ncbi:MAG: hypothetical protein AB1847_18690 [bacterium]
MDQNTQKITGTLSAFSSLLRILLVSMLFLLGAQRSAAAFFDSSGSSGADAEHERIDMQEMQIQGSIRKPSTMYVIPRADLKIEMKLHDEYFLPKAPDDLNETTGAKSMTASAKEISFCFFKSSFYAVKPEIKEGSCVSCHYSEMAIPKSASTARAGSSTSPLLQELNQSCLRCHPSRYYHIFWKEVQKTVFQSPHQSQSQDNEGKGNCQKCHAPWMLSQGKQPQGAGSRLKGGGWNARPKGWGSWRSRPLESQSWGKRPQDGQTQGREEPAGGRSGQGYDVDTFCITCHRH